MEVQGRLVVITGSAQGIGRACADQLLQAGASVCLSDLNSDAGEKTRKEFSKRFGEKKVHFIACDVTKLEDVTNLYEGCEKHFDRSVDIFCNNAGINWMRGWKLCMEIDIMAVMQCTEYVMQKMDISKGGKGGVIVNTASTAGIAFGNEWSHSSYFTAKHGVVALSRSLGTAEIEKETGVKVLCLCPSLTKTAIMSDVEPDKVAAAVNRLGVMEPETIADGFMKLVTQGGTGDVMLVVRGVPPFIYGDVSRKWAIFLSIGSRLFKSMFGVELFTVQHQFIYMFIVFALFHFLLYTFFSMVF